MVKLIVKSPYLKCGGAEKVSGYLRCIGTREHVQKLTDDRPPTRKQEQLITKLSKDFPAVKKLAEYEDYTAHETKVNASALITMALEEKELRRAARMRASPTRAGACARSPARTAGQAATHPAAALYRSGKRTA
ncbi:MAG: relaxase MobL [Oscillospiraceae bacterium]|nr:relaxase MobL [Oscillospiraceae bacterium]